jgi:hypothetical protein
MHGQTLTQIQCNAPNKHSKLHKFRQTYNSKRQSYTIQTQVRGDCLSKTDTNRLTSERQIGIKRCCYITVDPATPAP